MSYVIDKEMIHRLGAGRTPTYCIVATATNSEATQTIVASSTMVGNTQAQARTACTDALDAQDAAIT